MTNPLSRSKQSIVIELKSLCQVLVFGCWSTRSELAGLTQPEKVARLQGILNTQVLPIFIYFCAVEKVDVMLGSFSNW